MTRAEATARVVAAAKRVSGELEAARALWPSRNEAERAESLRRLLNEDLHLHDSIKALDACPPKDEDAVVAMWYDLRDAWALAWAGWQEAYDWREHNGYGPKWNFGSHEGWPTRDAEHAAWAGRYRAREGAVCGRAIPLTDGTCTRPAGHPPNGCERFPLDAPAPAQSAASVPELAGGVTFATGAAQGDSLDDVAARVATLEAQFMDAMTAGWMPLSVRERWRVNDARLDALAAQVGVIDERLSVEEANALNDGIADRMRLTALEAQVGRVERAVRAMATRTARDMLDGGPDA